MLHVPQSDSGSVLGGIYDLITLIFAGLMWSKANSMTPVCGEGKYGVYCRCQVGRMGSSCLNDLNS